jgi:hypothetical protein
MVRKSLKENCWRYSCCAKTRMSRGTRAVERGRRQKGVQVEGGGELLEVFKWWKEENQQRYACLGMWKKEVSSAYLGTLTGRAVSCERVCE